MRKYICLLLLITVMSGQVFASEPSNSSLSPSLITDTDIYPSRSGRLGADIARKLEPGAIGNGAPLLELAQGRLPARIPDTSGGYTAKAYEAIESAIRRIVYSSDQIPAEHKDRCDAAIRRLVDLQNHLESKLYLFDAEVRGPEDYLLGFNSGGMIGLSSRLIDKLHALPPDRMAQYIYHECVPENGLSDREEHRIVYKEIQSVIFGCDEVLALKRDLREFINDNIGRCQAAVEGPGHVGPREMRCLADLQKRAEALLSKSPFTPTGGAWMETRKQQGRTLRIVALKDHYSKEAIDILFKEIAPRILESDPSKTLFIIEKGLEDTPEDILFKEFAESFNMKIAESPIVSPYNSTVAMLADVDPAWAASVVAMAEFSQYASRINSDFQTARFLGYIASKFNVDRAALELTFARFFRKGPEERLNVMREIFERLIAVSNDLSYGNIRSIFAQYPAVDSVVVLIGGNHLPAFDSDYSPGLDISEEDAASIKTAIKISEMKALFADLEVPINLTTAGDLKEEQCEEDDEIARFRMAALREELGQTMYENDFKDAVQFWHDNLFALNYVRRNGGSKRYLSMDSPLKKLWGVGALIQEIAEHRKSPLFSIYEIDSIAGYLRALGEADPKWSETLNILADNSDKLLMLYHRLYGVDRQILEDVISSRAKSPDGARIDELSGKSAAVKSNGKKQDSENQHDNAAVFNEGPDRSTGLTVLAMKFKINLEKILTENPDELFLIGIEDDIGQDQKSQIMPVYKAIDEIGFLRNAKNEPLFPNLMVKRGSAAKLVEDIGQLRKERRLSLDKTFICARLGTINDENGPFKEIKGEGKAWMSVIDDSNADDYLPVFEAITLNMLAYLRADLAAIKNFYDTISDNPVDAAELQKMVDNRIIYILPKATKLSMKELRDIYELAHQVYLSA